MGSFTRVNVIYKDLESFFKNNNLKVFGTSSDQNKNYKKINNLKGIILLGSESHGISKNLIKYVDEWLSIKKVGNAESLNVSVASGILLNDIINS